MFPGFYRPKANFYRLPNDWFDIWAQIRRWARRSRIHTILKMMEYVIKWTWGYQNYDEPVRISWRNFQFGMLKRRKRRDRGTGLSPGGLQGALQAAEEFGLLEKRENDDHGPSYLPRLQPLEEGEENTSGPNGDESDAETWIGFNRPEANYFMVPTIWTDLTSDVNSATFILTVEYFFRHTWGWQGGWDEPCWLTEDEIASGRRYRSPQRCGERYDDGIGYSTRSIRDALAEGVRRRWLVWYKDGETGKKHHALHLKGMNLSDDGEFLGFGIGDEKEERSQPPIKKSAPDPAVSEGNDDDVRLPVADSTPNDSGNFAKKVTQLQTQVDSLTQTVVQLQEAVRQVLFNSFRGQGGVEAIEAPPEAIVALWEAIVAPGGSYCSASYTDTFSDTVSQTPPPDTAATSAANGKGVGGGGISSHLLKRLMSLDPPISSRKVAAKLVETYGEQRVAAMLEAVERDPTAQSVAAVLIYRLKDGQTPPERKQGEETVATDRKGPSRWQPDVG